MRRRSGSGPAHEWAAPAGIRRVVATWRGAQTVRFVHGRPAAPHFGHGGRKLGSGPRALLVTRKSPASVFLGDV